MRILQYLLGVESNTGSNLGLITSSECRSFSICWKLEYSPDSEANPRLDKDFPAVLDAAIGYSAHRR